MDCDQRRMRKSLKRKDEVIDDKKKEIRVLRRMLEDHLPGQMLDDVFHALINEDEGEASGDDYKSSDESDADEATAAKSSSSSGSDNSSESDEEKEKSKKKEEDNQSSDEDSEEESRLLPNTQVVRATVLFIDLKHFTSYTEKLTLRQMTNRIKEFNRKGDKIARNLGIWKVNNCGDSIQMVGGCTVSGKSFGTVCDVLEAGHRLLKAVKKLRWSLDLGPMKARVGVTTGDVSVAVLSRTAVRGSVLGDVVNTAARLESTANSMTMKCDNRTKLAALKYGKRCTFAFDKIENPPALKGKEKAVIQFVVSRAR